jgi:hypothetical protein
VQLHPVIPELCHCHGSPLFGIEKRLVTCEQRMQGLPMMHLLILMYLLEVRSDPIVVNRTVSSVPAGELTQSRIEQLEQLNLLYTSICSVNFTQLGQRINWPAFCATSQCGEAHTCSFARIPCEQS